MKKFIVLAATAAAVFITGCTRIETGEVGIRIDATKQVQGAELLPGSFNQTLIGDVLTFPVKDITLTSENMRPLTADNSALDDFDVNVVYNISPNMVAELYATKARSFHYLQNGDVYLMYSYMQVLVKNASEKAVRQYKSLEVADNREKIEDSIGQFISRELDSQNLGKAITITAVQIRNITPNAAILAAATEYVQSQNQLKIRENEVKIAEAESRRMAALAANSQSSIAYMQAQAELNYSEAAKLGKINTIIVPRDFRGMVNVPK